MIGTQIKPDYSEAVAKFVANGGEIKSVVNTNKAEFNYCNADTVLQSAERPNNRRRARAKTGLSSKNLEAIGHYLLGKGEAVEFTSGGKKYVLKVEVA